MEHLQSEEPFSSDPYFSNSLQLMTSLYSKFYTQMTRFNKKDNDEIKRDRNKETKKFTMENLQVTFILLTY